MDDKLIEALQTEFVRCTFPEGRAVYMREFEEKFETSVNDMKLPTGINRQLNPYWKNRC